MIKIKFEPPIIQAIPLSPDDLIEVQAICSTALPTLDLEGSCYNDQGDIVPFQQSLSIPSLLSPTTFYIRLGYKFLLSAVLHCRTADIPDGSCYCRLSLCKSASSGVFPYRKILAQGYISTFASIGYGSSSINDMPRDHFYLQNIAVADPAAGAQVDYTCPVFTRHKIISVCVDFLTSAAVANRQHSFRLSLPLGDPHSYKSSYTQMAGSNYNYVCAPAQFTVAGTTANSQTGSIPYFELFYGCILSSFVFNIQAADQHSNYSILCLTQVIPFR